MLSKNTPKSVTETEISQANSKILHFASTCDIFAQSSSEETINDNLEPRGQSKRLSLLKVLKYSMG